MSHLDQEEIEKLMSSADDWSKLNNYIKDYSEASELLTIVNKEYNEHSHLDKLLILSKVAHHIENIFNSYNLCTADALTHYRKNGFMVDQILEIRKENQS